MDRLGRSLGGRCSRNCATAPDAHLRRPAALPLRRKRHIEPRRESRRHRHDGRRDVLSAEPRIEIVRLVDEGAIPESDGAEAAAPSGTRYLGRGDTCVGGGLVEGHPAGRVNGVVGAHRAPYRCPVPLGFGTRLQMAVGASGWNKVWRLRPTGATPTLGRKRPSNALARGCKFSGFGPLTRGHWFLSALAVTRQHPATTGAGEPRAVTLPGSEPC